MNEGIKRNKTEKDRLINQIIQKEQIMFDGVRSIHGRAPCQDDHDTFYVMRYSQQYPLKAHTLKSYLKDLTEGENQGRNLIEEKYGYMMEETEPAYFKLYLEPYLPKISQEKTRLVERLVKKLTHDHLLFLNKYPYYGTRIRQLEGNDGQTSSQSYLKGELKTYSLNTLYLYEKDVITESAVSLVEEIQKVTVTFYGYETIEEAESYLKTVNAKG